MAIEPPLKKRKHYDDAASTAAHPSSSQSTEELPSSTSLSEEQKLRKKMNRDEIGAFYKTYRRLKFCSGRNRNNPGPLSDPELEEAYSSILNLATGTQANKAFFVSTECIPRRTLKLDLTVMFVY